MIWSLQALRFAAALMVVYLHSAQVARQVTGSNGFLPAEFQLAGQAGVDIFFVISGFIIAATAPGLTWKQFAQKRFRRIMPVYLVICIPVLLIALQAGISIGWRELLATVFLWPATDVMTVPLLPVAWTLCFEALFYAAATLVLADRRWLTALAAIFMLSFAMRTHGSAFQFLGNPLILEFLLGVGIAHAPKSHFAWLGIPIGAVAIAAAGFAGLAPTGNTLSFLTGESGLLRVLVYGIPAALIVFGVSQLKMKRSIWTVLGDGSYMLYLTHPLLLPVLLAGWRKYPAPPDLVITVCVIASIAFAQWLHLRFEKPWLAGKASKLDVKERETIAPPKPDNAPVSQTSQSAQTAKMVHASHLQSM
jgi:exopolysaccharide production protein ExoZ